MPGPRGDFEGVCRAERLIAHCFSAREAAAWLAQADGHSDTALRLLESAVELEESTEKDPVTPGPVLPAWEQLGELLVAMGRPAEGLAAFSKTEGFTRW